MTEQERSAIQDAITALDDVTAVYASLGKGYIANGVDDRIKSHGGTIAYLTSTREKLERILKAQ